MPPSGPQQRGCKVGAQNLLPGAGRGVSRFMAASARPLRRSEGATRPGAAWMVCPNGPLPALVQTRHGVDFRIPPLPPPPPAPPPLRDAGRWAKASDRKLSLRRARSAPPRPVHVPPLLRSAFWRRGGVGGARERREHGPASAPPPTRPADLERHRAGDRAVYAPRGYSLTFPGPQLPTRQYICHLVLFLTRSSPAISY